MKKKLLLMLVLLISCTNVLAQQLTIRGTVTDATTGESIIGAHVMLQGTDKVVITDLYGNYEIKADEGSVLHYSFLGYLSQEATVTAGEREINIVLAEELTSIDAVVAVGYGVTKKKLVTGANLNVDGDQVAKMNTTTAMEALKGVAPGVSVTSNNGAPGAGTSVTIRGLGTVGSSSPLYIVDGVEVGNIDNINPLSIESIDVLKDAASAAIYGSRAANGVILVTTKKGRQNQKTTVSYSGYVGVQNLAQQPSSLNAQEYMFIQDEMRINSGLAGNDWETMLKNNSWLNAQQDGLGTEYGEYVWNLLENGWEGTNWMDEIVSENAIVTSHSLNVTGGGSKTTYAMGFSYYDQDGLVGSDLMDAGYTRMNVTFNSDMILFADKDGRPVLTFGENINYAHTSSKYVATGNQYWNDVYNALKVNPLMPAYWEGSLDEQGFAPILDGINTGHNNPLQQLYYNRGRDSDNGSNNINGNVYLNFEPIKGLTFRSSYGISASFWNSRSFSETYAGSGQLNTGNTQNSVSQGMGQYTQYTFTNTANWKKDFGKHSVSVLLGHEMTGAYINMGVGGSQSNSLYSDLEHAYISNCESPESVTDISLYGYDWAATGGGVLSFMGRASYSYDDKYMFDMTMRADGSSNFDDGNKWGYFPSFSAGWNFSEESWMEEFDWLSFGKLRASWGQNGNQTLMDSSGNYCSFIYSSNISTTTDGYYFGDNKLTSSSSSYPSNVPTKDITWETSEQLNFGLDLRFLSSRLGVTFDWYQKTTKDWLVEGAVIGTSGASSSMINGGSVRNSGVELSVSWQDQIDDFTYGATLSMFHNENTVLSLNTSTGYISGPTAQIFDNCDYMNRVDVGMPIGYFYGYKTDGVLQNQSEVDAYVNADGTPYFEDAQPGDLKFVDVNGDGIIDENDKTMIGNPNADFEVGLQLNFGYKGAYLNLTGSGKFGQQVFNSYFWGHGADNNLLRNWTTEIFNRWTGEGTSNKIPRLTYGSHRNGTYLSDAYVYDADFFRINNLTIGYDISRLFKEKVSWISNLSIYLSANNLYTFTGYDGLDPDVSYGGENCSWGSGLDLGLYPLSRTYMIGVNLTF